ncbi:MAG: response regulator, partial [Candidatus Delongbacteria bacterium]
MNKILWVDDEIDLLKPHILYLERKGYDVSTATNGLDAVRMVKSSEFDLVVLDEMMVGMDGLETLRQVKGYDSSIKAIMLTKSEEEGIFLEAIGSMIDDYLTKPVSPLQLYLSIRKNIEKENIVTSSLSKNYIKSYRMLSTMLENDPDHESWIRINEMMNDLSLKLDDINDPN